MFRPGQKIFKNYKKPLTNSNPSVIIKPSTERKAKNNGNKEN